MTTDAREKHVSLFFQQGSSDKEYHLHLVPKGEGWVVDFQYGKRGKALRSGSKTKEPVDYGTAEACYDKALKGQLKDGYTPTEGGVMFQDTDRSANFTGIVPQLLNPIDDDALEAWFNDPLAFGQEKHDGERRLLKVADGQATGINRRGLTVALSKPIEAACLSVMAKTWVADGEDLGEHIVLFDLLEMNGQDLRSRPAAERLMRLESLVVNSGPLKTVQTAHTEADKRALFNAVRVRNGEGVVFKKANAAYTPGRPASGGTQTKYKFTASATARVCAGRATKRSVGLEVLDADGTWVSVGNVSIPANRAVPEPGNLVEVNYLYAFPGGSLFQPTYARERPDLTEEACSMAQLKYKAGTVAPVEPAPANAKKRKPRA